MKKFLILIIWLGIIVDVEAQEAALQDSFRNYLESTESLSFISLHFDLAGNAKVLFPVAEEYLKMAARPEKRKYYELILAIGAGTEEESVKKQTIAYMLEAYEEEKRPELGLYYLERMTIFNRNLFDSKAKTRIKRLLRGTRTNTKQLILLVGFLQITEEIEYLRNTYLLNSTLIESPGQNRNYFNTVGWHAHLALARMGDKEAINHVVQKFHGVTDHWNLCRSIVQDIDYVRHEKSHQLLVDLALKKEYLTPKDSSSTPCNFYLLPLLLKSTKNYPHERIYYPDSEDEILEWFEGTRKLVINQEVY